MPPQMGSMMPGLLPTKEEQEQANRMVRLESWASMVMHTMVGKRNVTEMTEPQLSDDPTPYAQWVAKLSFAVAAKMEEERCNLAPKFTKTPGAY